LEFSILDLREVNKLLSAIADLTGQSGTVLSDSVREFCNSIVLGGRKHNHVRLIELSSFLGLVVRKGNRLALSREGREYISRNPNRFYELTLEQKTYLTSNFIFSGKMRLQTESICRQFIQDHKRGTWLLDILDRPLPNSLIWLIELMVGLGILEKQQPLFLVAREYVHDVTRLISAKVGPTPAELEAILGAKRRLGDLGEVQVQEFEKRRLQALGRPAEAELVSRISEIDTSAGFDIKSFDGDEPAFDYNRFIEVKTSQDLKLRFNWSRNEYEIAESLAEKYWIYFCGGLDSKNPQHFDLIMIQDPIRKLREINAAIEPSEFLVQLNESPSNMKRVSFGNNLQAIVF
jgi:hypothetical protein